MEKINEPHWTSDDEKLEAYILNKLESEEFKRLESHLKHCTLCQLRVKQEKDIIDGIKRFGKEELKQRLKKLTSQAQPARLDWVHVVSIAASILIILSATLIIKWYLNLEEQKNKLREIVLSKTPEHTSTLWIVGKIIEIKGKYSKPKEFLGSKPTVDKLQPLPSIAEKEKSYKNNLDEKEQPQEEQKNKRSILVTRRNLGELPDTLKLTDYTSIRTRLERIQNGLKLIIYTNIIEDSTAEKVEFVSKDSIIVVFSNKLVAYKIPPWFLEGI